MGELRRGVLLLALTGVLWGSIGLVARLLQDRGQPAVTITFWPRVRERPAGAPARTHGTVGAGSPRTPTDLDHTAVAVGFLRPGAYFYAVRDVGVSIPGLIALGLAPVILPSPRRSWRARGPPRARWSRSRRPWSAWPCWSAFVLRAASRAATADGIVEAVGCGVAYAATTSCRRGSPVARPLTITFATTSAVGAVILLTSCRPVGTFADLPTVAGVLSLAVVATVIAYGLFTQACAPPAASRRS